MCHCQTRRLRKATPPGCKPLPVLLNDALTGARIRLRLRAQLGAAAVVMSGSSQAGVLGSGGEGCMLPLGDRACLQPPITPELVQLAVVL
jgi:hypothetical protein